MATQPRGSTTARRRPRRGARRPQSRRARSPAPRARRAKRPPPWRGRRGRGTPRAARALRPRSRPPSDLAAPLHTRALRSPRPVGRARSRRRGVVGGTPPRGPRRGASRAPARPRRSARSRAPAATEAETPTPTAAPTADDPVTWTHVAPIFAKRCVECHKHGGDRGPAPEGLELISLDRVRAGGERVALIPGNPLASPIVRHVRGIVRPRMPLDGPPFLSDAEIELLERWIRGGAREALGAPSPVPAGREVGTAAG